MTLRYFRHLLGHFNNLGRHAAWVAPLLDVLIFSALGMVFYIIARQRRADLRQTAVTVYAFSSALIVLQLYHPISDWARLLLAAGLGVQIGRLASRWPGIFDGVVERTLAWPILFARFLIGSFRPRLASTSTARASRSGRDLLLGTAMTLGGLAIAVHGPPVVREWYALQQLPAIPGNRPNVLFIVLDTVRASSLSLYGYPRDTTPQLTRLAAEGTMFRRAYSHSSWTLPAHAAFFTGRYPHELSTTWETPLDGSEPTIAEVLAANGFITAGFVANTNYCSYESGLSRGFHHYEDYTLSAGGMLNDALLTKYLFDSPALARTRGDDLLGRTTAEVLNGHVLSWLSQPRDRPFFAFLNYFDAHAPYLAPPPFDTAFGSAARRPNPSHSFGWEWTREQERAELDAYDSTIAYLDAQVGALIDALRARGILENTIVMVISDHGELLGEHELMDHANSLYSQLLHVPVLMIWPGRIPAGRTVDQPVGLRHIAATILDLVQLEPGGIAGQSLARFWRPPIADGRVAEEPILATLDQGIRVDAHWRNAGGDVQSIISGDRHYILNQGTGVEELYDLLNDPGETTNIAATADTRALREALQRLLRQGSR